ncbi:PREDICTED: pentatricopeptide repeat-containing protein At1g20230-like [Camelina sativa]|uniref:Pentatricopeptide repeat-containing protein At1g20230-like n=1 Tax=Camelina sativa TaxID=90675 RepID=A0ABM0YBA8_CAMSA|nr:PREDICTED: pentatricopeptide repeat-containing protein At1g20230-like [Camelina sativa]
MTTKQVLPLIAQIPQSIVGFLESSSSLWSSSLSKTTQAHARILKSGAQNDGYISAKLIASYSNYSCFDDADLVLQSIPDPSVYSFSSLIYALTKAKLFSQSIGVFSRMFSHGLIPDTHVLPNLFKVCAELSAFNVGKQIHCVSCVSGLDMDAFVQGSLFHMYMRCGRMGDARKVFDRMSEKGVVTCSALLCGYARKGCLEEVVRIFSEMEKSGIEPNIVSWNGVLSGFNRSGFHREAVIMFQKMHRMGFGPDQVTVSSVLPSVGDSEMLNFGKLIHGYVIKQGLLKDKCVISAMIDMYGKSGNVYGIIKLFDEVEMMETGVCNAYITGLSRNGLVDKALEMFELFKEQKMDLNVVSWTSIIAGCAQNGKDIEALELFREMQVAGVKPNRVTIPSMLPACGNIAALGHGRSTHGFAVRVHLSDDFHVGSALIDMYAKCGRINMSQIVFSMMPTKNLVCWNSLLNGYSMHGKAKEVMSIFESLVRTRLKPDFISFTSLLSSCGQVGLTDEGWKYFSMMSEEYGIKPRLEHYSCMVNLLGRAGKLQEAYDLIKEMPFEPDSCVWGALLNSCRLQNNVDLAEIAADKLFNLEPENPGTYVLLSNIYAAKGMWTEVDSIRNKMESQGLKKNPGCSWIQVKNKVYTLLAGDKSHPQIDQITEKMDEIREEMRKSGHRPNLDFALQDVEEQEQEQMLWGHSEKLAVVFGLLNTPDGTPLQVIKNLRICGDCHSVIKFISSYAGREIFVRDTNRFHHFKDGICSCGDFW